jgi:hypothetical protein
MTDEKIIFNIDGSPRGSIQDLLQSLVNMEEKATLRGLEKQIDLPGCYVQTADTRFPISAIVLTYDLEVSAESITIDGAETARAILKDTLSGKHKAYFSKDGSYHTFN